MSVKRIAVPLLLSCLLAGCTATGAAEQPRDSAAPSFSATVPQAKAGGLRVDADVLQGTHGVVSVRLRVRDDDGLGVGYRVQYGDGQYDEVMLADIACTTEGRLPSPPPAPLDRTVELQHGYAEPGSYNIDIRVLTQGGCGGAPREEVNARETVWVADGRLSGPAVSGGVAPSS